MTIGGQTLLPKKNLCVSPILPPDKLLGGPPLGSFLTHLTNVITPVICESNKLLLLVDTWWPLHLG